MRAVSAAIGPIAWGNIVMVLLLVSVCSTSFVSPILPLLLLLSFASRVLFAPPLIRCRKYDCSGDHIAKRHPCGDTLTPNMLYEYHVPFWGKFNKWFKG